MDEKEAARRRIEDGRDALFALSRELHANPELRFEEVRSSARVADALAEVGYGVEWGIGGLPTAFVARLGSGPVHVGICAEYDALPFVGHACGHNLIAAMAVGAGLALAQVADDVGLTVSVFGTPAEEGGGGKITMLEAGAFEGVHAALMVHPGPVDDLEPPVLAAQTYEIRYEGREAHAAAYPELGINAADALVVAQTAIGLLRQHLRPTDRVHGIVTKGGDAPNIVPAHTAASYMARAETVEQLEETRAKLARCFEAGAIATGASVSIEARPPYAHMRHDPVLVAAYKRNADQLGRSFAPREGRLRSFSTDMGNVSLEVPSIHPIIGIDSFPAVNHQPEFTAHCVSASADAAILDAAIAMAWTAIDAAADDELRSAVARQGD